VSALGEAIRLGEMVARTPPSRDRVRDFLQTASIVAVVFGHWMIGIVWWQDGLLRTTSAVGVTTGLWLATTGTAGRAHRRLIIAIALQLVCSPHDAGR